MKNVKNKLKSRKGITLVALVVTIIILLILAGITIAQLGSSGLLGNAQKAKTEYKKSQYFEDINMEIFNEQVERAQHEKEEPFIVSLKNRIEKNHTEWVSSVVMCDEEGNENENESLNTVLIVTTQDGYEIFVDVDNGNKTATVREGSFKKASAPCTVTYDAGEGSGTVAPQEIRAGFSATLRSSEGMSKDKYIFVGWCKNEDGTGDRYEAGSKLRIEEDTKLYAIWKLNVYTIEYIANDGTETPANTTVNVEKGEETTLLGKTTFTKAGYDLINWNTKPDGSGTNYTFEQTTTPTADITLYAQWKKDPEAGIESVNANYVQYFGKKYSGYSANSGNNWRLFYADSNYAYLISDSIGTKALNSLSGWNNNTLTTSNVSKLGKNLNPKFKSWDVQANNENIKAVAALTDKTQWTDYKGTNAEWAIGAPPIEMFMASFNATHSKQMENKVESSSSYGYVMKWSTTTVWSNYLSDLPNTSNLDKAIYSNSSYHWWLSSPHNHRKRQSC